MNTTPKSPYILSGLLRLCIQFCKMLIHNNYLVWLMVAYNSDNVNYFYLTEFYRKNHSAIYKAFFGKKVLVYAWEICESVVQFFAFVHFTI